LAEFHAADDRLGDPHFVADVSLPHPRVVASATDLSSKLGRGVRHVPMMVG
jgi:hypothetical protein